MSSGPERQEILTADSETATVSAITSQKLDYCWVILAVGTLAIFGALGLGRFGCTAVLPAMQQGLGMDNTLAGAMASMNLAGYLALSALGGALAARFGPRRVITAGLVLAVTGIFFTGMADSFGSFAPAFLLAALVAFSGAIGATRLRPVITGPE